MDRQIRFDKISYKYFCIFKQWILFFFLKKRKIWDFEHFDYVFKEFLMTIHCPKKNSCIKGLISESLEAIFLAKNWSHVSQRKRTKISRTNHAS